MFPVYESFYSVLENDASELVLRLKVRFYIEIELAIIEIIFQIVALLFRRWILIVRVCIS